MLFMPFLYFPEDKTEYIPAVIMLIIFMALAVGAMYFMYKRSKKEEEKFEEKYKEQIKEAEADAKQDSTNK